MSEHRYQYIFALIDLNTGMCIGIDDTTQEYIGPQWIQVPVFTNDYLLKYYNRETAQWYEDASFSIPWSPSI